MQFCLSYWLGEWDMRFFESEAMRQNLDFRLRPDSPALKAGVAVAQVTADVTGKPRPKEGPCSLGCYEGAFTGSPAARTKPEVVIADGEDRAAIEALLKNEHEFLWHGMLWGWGKLLTEELPFQVEVRGPRKANFLSLEGRFALGDLLQQIVSDHHVRLVLRQPGDSKDLGTGAEVVSSRIAIRRGADAEARAYVRRVLRHCICLSGRLLAADPSEPGGLQSLPKQQVEPIALVNPGFEEDLAGWDV